MFDLRSAMCDLRCVICNPQCGGRGADMASEADRVTTMTRRARSQDSLKLLNNKILKSLAPWRFKELIAVVAAKSRGLGGVLPRRGRHDATSSMTDSWPEISPKGQGEGGHDRPKHVECAMCGVRSAMCDVRCAIGDGASAQAAADGGGLWPDGVRRFDGDLRCASAAADVDPCPIKHVPQHRVGQPTGEGVLLAGVIRTKDRRDRA